MKTTDPFSSPKRRLGRAKHHIRDLERSLKAYFKKDPYIRVIELHTDGVSQALKVKLRRQLPDRATDAAYDAIEALRSALDQTAYAVATFTSHPNPNQIHFPVTDDPAQFENTIRGRCKGLHPDIVELFRSFKAYPGGNDLLVALNRIRRQGFHRLLQPIGSALYKAEFGMGMIQGGSPYPTFIPSMVWDREKDEMLYAVIGPRGQLHLNFNFSFIVAFGKVEGLAGAPAIPALNAIAERVESVLAATEAESKRLGLV